MRRPERLAEALREVISEIVGFELDDPRLLSATVTEVVVAESLRDAKVYVVVEGSEEQVGEAMKALHRASSFVKQQVAMNLNLHHVPHLHFVRDTAEENVTRVEELLGEIAARDGQMDEDKSGE